MALSIGKIINNRYRIVKLLGQGGFGAVYRAWDKNLNKPCALKENLDVTPEAQRQFEREAVILAGLDHPNLPRVIDHFTVVGQGQYLVMDFVDGEDLQQVLDQAGDPLPESLVLPWVEQICDALDYLHGQSQPIIHRDIKPANIKIAPEGKAVLVDFGIAKVYDEHLRTTIGAQAVTPGYSPFEQYGQGATDSRTDVYALSATIYALLTGQVPPDSIQRMNQDTLPPPRRLNPTISRHVDIAIMRALATHPTGRFRRIGDFKSALHHTTVLRSVFLQKLSLQNLRHYWWVGAVVILLITAGLWGVLGPGRSAAVPPTIDTTSAVSVRIPSSTLTPFQKPSLTQTPTPTFTISPSSTLTPTITPSSVPEMPESLVLRNGQAIPWPQEPLLAENVDRISELGLWGLYHRVQRIDFSHDGTLMAAGMYRPLEFPKGLVYLWSTQTGSAPELIEAHNGGIDGLDFSNDGSYLAWGSWHGLVALFDLQTSTVVLRPSDNDVSVNALAFSPDSARLVWGKSGGYAEGRNLGFGANEIVVDGLGDVQGIAFSPDNRYMAVGSTNGKIVLQDIDSGVTEEISFGEKIRGIAFSPTGDRLAVTGFGGGIVVMDLETRNKIFETTLGEKVWDVVFSIDGNMIITADSYGDVKFWSLNAGHEVRSIRLTSVATSLALTANGTILATGDWDGLVKLWGIPRE
jgi:eukaryotic-like serine/threonine-protein kinase